MTDKEQFVLMLVGAHVSFEEHTTRGKRHVVDVDSGGGAVAIFDFNAEGILVAFDIDKSAY